MDKDQRNIRPVIEYIIGLFPEPYSLPTYPYQIHISGFLYRFIKREITYNDCCYSVFSMTGVTFPVEKLNSIMNVVNQPLPSTNNNNINNNIDPQGAIESDQKSNSNSMSTKKRKKCKIWSNVEDERLLCAVLKYGLDNWSAISRFIGNNRTRSQCCQRWTRGLDPRISKNQWTFQEDKLLMTLVQSHGTKSWTQIASVLGNRSDVQCRYHYQQLLKDTKNKSLISLHNNNTNVNVNDPTNLGAVYSGNFNMPMNCNNNDNNNNNNNNNNINNNINNNNNNNINNINGGNINLNNISYSFVGNNNNPNISLPKACVSKAQSLDTLPNREMSDQAKMVISQDYEKLPLFSSFGGISQSRTLGSFPKPTKPPQIRNFHSAGTAQSAEEEEEEEGKDQDQQGNSLFSSSLFTGADDLISNAPDKWFMERISKEGTYDDF